MNIIETIRQEIDRRRNNAREWSNKAKYHGPHYHKMRGIESACDALLSFIDTLESEKPINQDELVKEINRYLKPIHTADIQFEPFTQITKCARHFAQWQKEQDEISKVNYEGARAVYDNTVQHLQEKIDEKYELGKKDMKEQMLKEAVEGEVVLNPYPTICLDDCKDYDFKDGDKVRVIILPKED